MTVRSLIRLTLTALQVLLLIACRGGGSSQLTPASYTIGGTVTGLDTGRQVVLANNGGDHSITLPLLRAYRAQLGRPLALVHFDAHCDTWPDHSGEPSGHGTWLREAIDEDLLDPRLTVQFGIRSPAERETREYVRERGGLIYTGRDLRGLTSAEQLRKICATVRTRFASAADTPVYLSLDIDCLDPAYAPGTGTPEPGGLATVQVMTLLEELHDMNWVGMDLCEVAPAYDHAEITSNAAATLVWTYLCGRMAPRKLGA